MGTCRGSLNDIGGVDSVAVSSNDALGTVAGVGDDASDDVGGAIFTLTHLLLTSLTCLLAYFLQL